jgi:hypothetical protein
MYEAFPEKMDVSTYPGDLQYLFYTGNCYDD